MIPTLLYDCLAGLQHFVICKPIASSYRTIFRSVSCRLDDLGTK